MATRGLAALTRGLASLARATLTTHGNIVLAIRTACGAVLTIGHFLLY